MKKIILYIAALGMMFTSCDVLEEKPESFISTRNFYKTPADALAALSAAYAPLGQNGFVSRNFVIMGEIPTDNMFPLNNNNDRVTLDNYVQTSQNVVLKETWQNFYIGITRCNVVIGRTPLIEMDQVLKDRIVGEAKFLRAFYYFQLVQYWGKVPLVVEEVTSLADVVYPERAPVDDVYAQIISDLQDAETKLPVSYGSADQGRATQGAAKAFLAKVYLTRKQYDLAATKAKEVMSAPFTYKLWDAYSDVYKIENEFGKEYIFDVSFIGGAANGQGGALIAFFAQENNAVQGRGFGSFKPTVELRQSFSANDKRLKVFFVKGEGADSVNYYCNKWVDPSSKIANTSGNNYPLMRYADVVLMYAEAYNKLHEPTDQNDAYNAVNAIRHRAGLDSLSGLNQAQLHDAILNERRLELCFEGHRWFDLVRTDTFLPVLQGKGYPATEKDLLMPLPQFEIDLNPNLLPNNPQY